MTATFDNSSDLFPGRTVRQELETTIRNQESLVRALQKESARLGVNDPSIVKIDLVGANGSLVSVTLVELMQELAECRAEASMLEIRGLEMPAANDALETFFTGNIEDARLKDLRVFLEFPFFALAKNHNLEIRKYQCSEYFLTIYPGATGAPTIWDKEILVHVVSQLVAAKNRNRQDFCPRIRVVAHELLQATGRGAGGREYVRLEAALDRLSNTRFATNIPTGGQCHEKEFRLIENYTDRKSRPENGRVDAIEITLSNWLFNAIEALEVLTLDSGYFQLAGGLERRVYELARKHCGRQVKFKIGIDKLHKKSGSRAGVKKFRNQIRGIVGKSFKHLLGYVVFYSPRQEQLIVVRDDSAGRSELGRAFSNSLSARSLIKKIPG